MIVEIMNV